MTTELDALRDRVSELEGLLGMSMEFPRKFGLTPAHERLLGVLLKRDFVTNEGASIAVYEGRYNNNGPTDDILKSQLCRMRKILRKFNVEVSTKWGQGIYLTADSKARLRALIEQFRREAA